ncbi:B12-binding domain-containing protein [Kribbella sp. VKM Ac-2568]|uniref:cobalamin B12-binding domain-containing protein n=1 Tax=Kribbella sp. VKM Ac-2568 TaxID=2512219 RepID=UPI0010486423|nr:cobalamin-dependent protein [Kribbella sp. VKM Ac-2568]TCM49360.1 methanogenic corrinoid protein MtbC1 [Kribbella sp. VKM Ac-2568]
MAELTESLADFEAALAAVDTSAAIGVVDDLLVAGVAPVTVLTGVIAAAQRNVGARWQRGDWTVAEEHAATAVAAAATEAVARHARLTPITRGKALVACAEREWHALPAMIIDCALRADGWDTTLLGASTPPLRLGQYLQDLGPDALAVSCSMLGALPTTRRFIEASTTAGIPIVVGGAAFGPDDLRARALGAAAWAPDAPSAVEAARALPAVVPAVAPLPDAAVAEQAALELSHRELVASLLADWQVDPGLEVAEDAVQQVLHAVWAGLMTGDPRVVPQTAAWIAEILRSRGEDPEKVTALGGLLRTCLRDYPLAHSLIDNSWPAFVH